jgi:hypothetical protein
MHRRWSGYVNIHRCTESKQLLIKWIGSLVSLQIFCNGKSIDDCQEELFNNSLIPLEKGERITGPGTHEVRINKEPGKHWSSIQESIFNAQQWKKSLSFKPSINHTLKKVFTPGGRLFQCNWQTKISIAVMTEKNSVPCIFANYNKSIHKSEGEILIRPRNTKREIFLWEM